QFAQGTTNENLIAGFIASDEYYALAQQLQSALSIDFSSPNNGLVTQNNITVTGQLNGGQYQPPSLTVRLDNAPSAPLSYDGFGNFSVTTTLPLDGTRDGTHTLHFYASDDLGDPPGSATFTFTLDTVPPTINFTSPFPNTTVGGNITLKGTV